MGSHRSMDPVLADDAPGSWGVPKVVLPLPLPEVRQRGKHLVVRQGRPTRPTRRAIS